MRRGWALLGSFAFLVLAPGTVAVYIPWLVTRWRTSPPFLGLGATRALGVALVALGAVGLVDSFARFAVQGRGTPAPVLPPRHLVVTGLYRHVRNPMYAAVVAAVLGQALLLGDDRLLVYGALLWGGFHLFVVGYEEPTLRRTFGPEYDAFRANVRRWIPRLRPWRGAPTAAR
jgi:protein-S-isoprenylcysteine O-methyltransferase Ste14